jgi:GMP synthase (glutamine-hydrolysing)
VRPFLLLATRAEDAAADDEYAAFLRLSGLDEDTLRRVRLEQAPAQVGAADLDGFSGVVLGGSPFTWSTPPIAKTEDQRRVEAEIDLLLDRIVEEDLPFFGACYGIGTLGGHQGAVIDTTYAEPIGAVEITLTESGRHDPLLGALPSGFEAFVGHKEAITELPAHAVHLASSSSCPVQAFRVRNNVYATQFHPELDAAGLHTRIDVYKHAGYFHPDAADDLKRATAGIEVVHPPRLLERFVELYAR